jgi:hypothetical protein
MRLSRTKLLSRETNARDAWLCIIATEGARTEKQYFAMFQNERVRVEVLATDADNKSSPQHVLNRIALFKEQYDFGEKDQLWLMIDRDRWPIENLKDVCRGAREESIGLAISNPCFEVWLLLHHRDMEVEELNCKAVEAQLRDQLGGYKKTNLNADLFRPYISEAVRRAKDLDTDTASHWPVVPGTRVYKVVQNFPQP